MNCPKCGFKLSNSLAASAMGKIKSVAKAQACRENGKQLKTSKGGRPPNPEIDRIMLAHHCSRQWAHQLLKRSKLGSSDT